MFHFHELPKQQILPTDQHSPTENSSVENQSGISDLGEHTQVLGKLSLMANNGLEPPKKSSLQETPSTDTSDQETADKANDQRLPLGVENDRRTGVLQLISELKTSMHSLAFLYDIARSKYADLHKKKRLHGANFRFLLDPSWVKMERSSLLEENKIWRENREALDANLKELISMLKIASSPDRYDTSTLGLGDQTIAQELKPYAAELQVITNSIRSKQFEAQKKGKVLQDLGANIKILADPEWFTNEKSSPSEENKIWRDNREALDANLKELISMLKIASASDTPVRYNTSTLSLGETIAEELKPYATELNEFENYVGRLTGNRRALDANIEKLITMLKITVKLEPFPDTPDGCDAFTINAGTMAGEIKPHAAELEAITNSIRSKQFETQKKKSFWAWLSAATTVVAVASVAYVAGQYSKSIRVQRG